MIPISLCILSWNKPEVLKKSLDTYKKNGLLDIVKEKSILFQEISENDYEIASNYGLKIIGEKSNIGIGKAFRKLVENSISDYVLLLEHDFNLVEKEEKVIEILSESVDFLRNDIDVVRLRHRKKFGEPLFAKEYIGKELTEFDQIANNHGTHLLESIYWCNPSDKFPEQIKSYNGEWFLTSSRWANFTNNPCLYKREFYLSIPKDFLGEGIELEYNISNWWCRQNYKVIQGVGLFKHNDFIKYGILKNKNTLI